MNDAYPTLEARIPLSAGVERRAAPVRVGRGAFARPVSPRCDRQRDCIVVKPSVRPLTRFFDPHPSSVGRRSLRAAALSPSPRAIQERERSARYPVFHFGSATTSSWIRNLKQRRVLPPRTSPTRGAEADSTEEGVESDCGGETGDGSLPRDEVGVSDSYCDRHEGRSTPHPAFSSAGRDGRGRRHLRGTVRKPA